MFARTEGSSVLLADATAELAEGGRARIASDLDRQVAKGWLEQPDAEAILALLSTAVVSDLGDCELVIEAIYENMDAKRPIFEQLDQLCGPDTILASNTTSLSVTELGRGLNHPVIGMHLFNPAPVMKLVEVIAGAHTPPELVTRTMELAQTLGKTPVEVQEADGFVVNRVLVPMINEAAEVFAAGTASAEDIDTAMKLGANHPMGPLALGDLIGLDVVLAIMEVLQTETGDSKYRAHPLLRKYVRAGWLGRKTRRGFFDFAR